MGGKSMKRTWSAEQIEQRLLKSGFKKVDSSKKKPMFSDEEGDSDA